VPPPKGAQAPAPASELGQRLLDLLERSADDQLLTDDQAGKLLQISTALLRRNLDWLQAHGAKCVELPGAGTGKRKVRRWSRRSLLELPFKAWDAPRALRESAS